MESSACIKWATPILGEKAIFGGLLDYQSTSSDWHFITPRLCSDHASRRGGGITVTPREDIGMERQQARARSLALAALAIATVSLAGPARAQTYDPNYPVCLQIYQGGMTDYYFECAYTSMPQCQASASGRAAQCVVNPYYGKGKVAPRKKRTQTY